MKGYHLQLDKTVKKQLKKMDRYQAKLITMWLYTKIDGIEDPRSIGKGLTANKSGLWRYRIGNYRAIVEIKDNELIVLALNVGHRKNVYDH